MRFFRLRSAAMSKRKRSHFALTDLQTIVSYSVCVRIFFCLICRSGHWTAYRIDECWPKPMEKKIASKRIRSKWKCVLHEALPSESGVCYLCLCTRIGVWHCVRLYFPLTEWWSIWKICMRVIGTIYRKVLIAILVRMGVSVCVDCRDKWPKKMSKGLTWAFICICWRKIWIVACVTDSVRTKRWTDKGFETLILLYRSFANTHTTHDTFNGQDEEDEGTERKRKSILLLLRYRFWIYNFHHFFCCCCCRLLSFHFRVNEILCATKRNETYDKWLEWQTWVPK